MNTEAIFFVRDIMKDKAGGTVFIGSSENGSFIHIGDKFVLRYNIPRTLDDILNERPMASPINCCTIALTVTAIDSMRQLIEELPPGVTGALYLSGEGIEHVTKNTFLKT